MGKARYLDEAGDMIRQIIGGPPPRVRQMELPLDGSDLRLERGSPEVRIERPGYLADEELMPPGIRAPEGPDFSGVEAGPLASPPDMELGSPLWRQMDQRMRAYDNIRRGRTGNLRNQNPQIAAIAGDGIRTQDAASAAARQADAVRARGMREGAAELGVAGAIAGAGLMLPSGGERSADAVTDTGGAAELAAESRPAPEVTAEDEEAVFTDRFKRQYLAREAKRAAPPAMQPSMEPAAAPADYSFQARELMNQLNAMRRQAGGEIPEAPQMMAEINRLLGMSNKQKNAPGYQPAMPTDHHGQAQMLIQQLNAMRRKAGGEVPEAQQIMAEVRRHQAMGDQMRNAR